LANRLLIDRNRKNIRKSGNIKKPSMHLKQGYFFPNNGRRLGTRILTCYEN